MEQCRGTTKKGLRCLKSVRPGTHYCRYHVGNDEHLIELVSAMTISKPVKKKTSGYIYIYTLDVSHNNAHVYDHNKQKYKSLNHSKSGFFKKLVDRLGLPPHIEDLVMSRTLMVKIGYTTKDPMRRLQEWTSKCKHPVMLLSPPARIRVTGRFDQSKLGWPVPQVQAVESAIHTELRGLFGKGHVECEGCTGRHNEWFLVPSGKMGVVFDTINYWVALYSDGAE